MILVLITMLLNALDKTTACKFSPTLSMLLQAEKSFSNH